MAEFINTIDAFGDDAVIDSLIDRTITEFKDDKITHIGNYAFIDCGSIQYIDCPSVTSISGFAFSNAGMNGSKARFQTLLELGNGSLRGSRLTYVDLPMCKKIGPGAFMGAGGPIALILRSDAVCTLDNVSAFAVNSGITPPITSGTGYIYVPRALVDSYKAATNWSTYATQFRALEDYTVDGTTTGELDESKI